MTQARATPAISVVVPAWNEERRIRSSLERLIADGPTLGIDEIVVVDDGSTDGTDDIVEDLAAGHPGTPRLVLLRHPANRGKGAALRTGLMAATAPLVGYLDADLSIGATGFAEARRLLADGAQVVVGYRISYTGQADGKGQPLLRRVLSIVFKRAQQQIVGLTLRDTQCPFKLFTREAARAVVPACHSDGWAFDVEVLLVAARRGMRIAELPVQWHFVGGSTVRADLRTIWRTLRDLLLVRLRHGGAG